MGNNGDFVGSGENEIWYFPLQMLGYFQLAGEDNEN